MHFAGFDGVDDEGDWERKGREKILYPHRLLCVVAGVGMSWIDECDVGKRRTCLCA